MHITLVSCHCTSWSHRKCMWVPTVSVMSQVCESKQDPLDIFPKNNMAHTSPISKCDIIYHFQNYEWIGAKEEKLIEGPLPENSIKLLLLKLLTKRQINHCIQITLHQPWVGQLTFSSTTQGLVGYQAGSGLSECCLTLVSPSNSQERIPWSCLRL